MNTLEELRTWLKIGPDPASEWYEKNVADAVRIVEAAAERERRLRELCELWQSLPMDHDCAGRVLAILDGGS